MALSYRGPTGEPGTALLERLRPLERWTRTPDVLDEPSGGSALCVLPSGIGDPVLVTSSGGLGPKLKIAISTGKHETAGRDLVAAFVNDIVTTGARPLFFVHHYSSGKLDHDVVEQVVSGVAEGCRSAGCALLAGETSELAGVHADGQYDLVGFAVGVVARQALLGAEHIFPGDHLVAIASSGLHADGHALARRVLEQDMNLWLGERVDEIGCTVGEALTEPTRIYAKGVAAMRESITDGVHALCNIGPGGIAASLARILPQGFQARVDLESFERPALFRVIAEGGKIDEGEMRRSFNLGVGMVAIVRADVSLAAVEALEAAGESAWVFGTIRAGGGSGVLFT